jgi:acyl-CoA dehydrogenase
MLGLISVHPTFGVSIMHFDYSETTHGYIQRVKTFMDEHVYPVEAQIYAETHELDPSGDWKNWQVHPLIETLKKKPKRLGHGVFFCSLQS